MLRKRGEILDTGYLSHTVDAATRVQRTHSPGGHASTYPATVLACQARGTLTSTPADGGHRGSKCVHTDAEPVWKSPLQKACPQVEFGCIPGSQVHFGKEMKVKERKQPECGPCLLADRGPGAAPAQVHSQCHARFQLLCKEGYALSRGNTHPWKVPRQLFIHHPTQETQALQTRDFNASLKRVLSKSPNIFQRRQKSTFLTPRDKTTTKEPQNAMLVR